MKKDIHYAGVIVGQYEPTGNLEADSKSVKQIILDSGLYKEPTLIDSMAGQANAFAHTAIVIYNSKLKNIPIDITGITPYIVNATFAIEVYLKAMYVFCNPEIKSKSGLKNIKGGHDLKVLFDSLPKKANQIFLAQSQLLRNKYNLSDGWDIHTCLTSLSKAFEDWRYIYEYEKKEVELQSIRYLLHVSICACKQLIQMDPTAERQSF